MLAGIPCRTKQPRPNNRNDNKQKCSWKGTGARICETKTEKSEKDARGMAGMQGCRDLVEESHSGGEWRWEWQFGMVEMLLSFVGLYISSFRFVSSRLVSFAFLVYWIRSMATMATISVAYFCGSVSPIIPPVPTLSNLLYPFFFLGQTELKQQCGQEKWPGNRLAPAPGPNNIINYAERPTGWEIVANY